MTQVGNGGLNPSPSVMMPRPLSSGRGSTVDATRRHNLSTILTATHHYPGRSRAELTRLSGLNRSTVGALVAELVELGLVHEVAPHEHVQRGRPSPLVYPKSDVSVISVHPDLDALTIGLVGLGGTVHERRRVPWPQASSVAETIRLTAQIGAELAAAHPGRRPIAAGVAVPGLIRADDSFVVRAPHLDWTHEPLGDHLNEALGLPTVVRNDARVATIAETVFGAGRGVNNLVYINGSASGIGGGAVIGGLTLRGRDGFGGELGHTAVAGGKETCHCGRRGCLETEVRLERLLAALGKASVDPGDLEDELSRQATNPAVRAEITRQLTTLAGAIGNFVSIFNPEVVVLGGFLSSLYAVAPQILDDAVAADAFAPIFDGVRIERAQLGSRLLLVGAAELAFMPLLRDPAASAVAV